jgi:hypothetical protein
MTVPAKVPPHLNALDRRRRTQIHRRPIPNPPLSPIDMCARLRKVGPAPNGAWQRIGIYAAGLARRDAGIAPIRPSSKAHLVVAAGSGERDAAVDASLKHRVTWRH